MSFPAVLWTRMVVGVIGRRGHLQAMLQINSLPLEPTLHPHPPAPAAPPLGVTWLSISTLIENTHTQTPDTRG